MTHISSKRKELIIFSLALGLSVPALLLLYGSGFLTEQLSDWRTPAMYAELCAAGAALFAADHFLKEPGKKALVLALISALFLWVHRILLPLTVTLIYCSGLALTGEVLLLPLRKKEGPAASRGARRAARDFMTGAAAMIIFLCFLSGIHAGGIGTARKAAAFLLLLAFLVWQLCRVSGWLPVEYESRGPECAREILGDRQRDADRRLLIFVLLILLMHAGRMNITLDYDSVHYGLRSAYILDNGRGFFENLGSINTVYYYPKGLEILALPLSGTPTYSFVLGISFWSAVLFLWTAGDAVSRHFGPGAGLRAAFLCACIPGIMNLSTSAKTDMITLLFQIMFVSEMMDWAGGTGSLLWAAAALVMTLALKPTAIAFSGILFFAALGFALVRYRREKKFEWSGMGLKAELPVLLLPAVALIGVTLRTLHLTGYPLVTVFTGIWEKLGMHGHYPLAAQNIPNTSAGFTAGQTAALYLRRLGALLIAPTADQDIHILIAWGTTLFPVLLFAILLALAAGRRPGGRDHAGQDHAAPADGGRSVLQYLLITLVLLLLFDLLTLKFLHQVDGNYYNLSYAAAAMTAAALWTDVHPSLLRGASPAVLTAVFMMSITNWAGARGLTEPKLLHYGFYDHESDVTAYMILNAKEPVYRYLKNAPRMRLLAMSEEPECYLFPCRAESYTDLEGSGGNVRLVKTLNEFKDYLEWAGITCLYAEDEFLPEHPRAEEILRFMNEDGSLSVIITQEGCTLYEYHAGIRD